MSRTPRQQYCRPCKENGHVAELVYSRTKIECSRCHRAWPLRGPTPMCDVCVQRVADSRWKGVLYCTACLIRDFPTSESED